MDMADIVKCLFRKVNIYGEAGTFIKFSHTNTRTRTNEHTQNTNIIMSVNNSMCVWKAT